MSGSSQAYTWDLCQRMADLTAIMGTTYDCDFSPKAVFETLTPEFGRVLVKSHHEAAEPETGFPGAWVLDGVFYTDEDPVTFEHEGRIVDWADDVLEFLDFYTREELTAQADEVWRDSQVRTRLDMEDRG